MSFRGYFSCLLKEVVIITFLLIDKIGVDVYYLRTDMVYFSRSILFSYTFLCFIFGVIYF